MTLDPKRLEAAAKQLDPLAFTPNGEVAPRGLEGTPKDAIDLMMATRRKSARHRASKAITAYLEGGDWQPIETVPYDEMVLFYRHDGNVVQDFMYDCGIGDMAKPYSHWQPLPQPPKKGE